MVIKQGISSKELMEYMSFFGLNYVYTAEELESARYQKQINNKEDKTIEEKYNVLLNKIFKVNGSVFENDEILPEYFEQYKNNYLSSYQKKYGSKKPYIKQEEALNLELDSINELIRTYKEKITESNSTNFRDIVNEFYKLYSSSCKTFLTDYYDIAKEKNNNQGAVILDYVKNERINNVLNTTLLDSSITIPSLIG